MTHLQRLAPGERIRIQILPIPDCGTGCYAVFIETARLEDAQREVRRLGGSEGLLRARFTEPVETPRETYSAYGYMLAEPAPRNFVAWGLPSSREERSCSCRREEP